MNRERGGVGSGGKGVVVQVAVVSLPPPQNDFFLGPFDMKNGFDVKCKNPKKSFCQESGFFPLIIHEKNDFFGKKPFMDKNHFSFFSV